MCDVDDHHTEVDFGCNFVNGDNDNISGNLVLKNFLKTKRKSLADVPE